MATEPTIEYRAENGDFAALRYEGRFFEVWRRGDNFRVVQAIKARHATGWRTVKWSDRRWKPLVDAANLVAA